MNRILLLEDDLSLIDGLVYALHKNDFEVTTARTVGEAMARLTGPESYDLLLLDVTLPDGTGFDVCEKVRQRGSRVPIIFLTASDEEVSIIRGLDCGDVVIDFSGSRVQLKGRTLDLTGAEYRLLCLLVQNAGQVVTRSRILDVLWDGSGDFVDDNTLSVYVRRLREKVEEDPSHPVRLQTVRGFGYRWMEVAP